MGERVRRFIPRAARYTLRPGDRTSMRFSLVREHGTGTGGTEETILLNLSETGAAFLVGPGQEPSVGVKIKVEIPIPHGDQMAWYGRVVRVQEYQTSKWTLRKTPSLVQRKILIGLRFEKLPPGHSRALQKGIELSFIRAVQEQKYKTLVYYKTVFFHHVPRMLFYGLLVAAAIGFIYYFSLPDEKYDSKRGTPWGERFKF